VNAQRPDDRTPEIERARPLSGWLGLLAALVLFGIAAALVLPPRPGGLVLGVPLALSAMFLLRGLATLEPNEAAVLVFFGKYVATIRRDGFFFVNPFYARKRVSLRVRNFNTPTLKVNDKAGNPIEVAAVITWRVADTAQAVFDVEDFEGYTHMQSEMGLREVASSHAYDGAGGREITLRGNFDRVAQELVETLHRHVEVAGVAVLEAKITHLAYAPEIASVMLRRQQAEAVVQAREKMVEGAIGMVTLALKRLEQAGTVEFTPPQRAALVTNMMTVLLSETGAQPVVPVAAG
jgi:regulator of protease activity HflC (stomatin/prohibitin superfamily)